MKSENCRNCITRRRFLQVAGGTAAYFSLFPLAESAFAGEPVSRTPIFRKNRAKVTVIFSHVPTGNPTWPSKDYDYDARAREITRKLRVGCPGIDFTIRKAHNQQEAETILKESGDQDGFIAYALGIWTWATAVVGRSGKPAVIVDDLYAGSGEVLITSGAMTREKFPVVVVSSSDFNDVIAAVRLFEVMKSMRESVILDVSDHDITAPANKIKELYGSTVLRCTSQEFAPYYDKADQREAAQWADYWMKSARKVVEPKREELVKSGRMYLALCKAVADNKADAVTLDCLGMFYSGRVTAYPCLSHFQMNNDGSTGVCEGDLNSTCTQLMMRYMTGRPGYVSDPVIDTATGEIIYAHCVSTNKVFGPMGKSNPFLIRSHAEDNKGASVQSLMPAGETVTTLEANIWDKRIVLHTAKTSRNIDESKACRTKLAARTNVDKILENWDMGWHRVTVYGDYRRQVKNLAKLMGFSVVEEDNV